VAKDEIFFFAGKNRPLFEVGITDSSSWNSKIKISLKDHVLYDSSTFSYSKIYINIFGAYAPSTRKILF
jgi:hypothetical protein